MDAAFAVEPFATVGVSQGMRVVAAPYTQTDEALTVAGYFTSDQYAAENADTVNAGAVRYVREGRADVARALAAQARDAADRAQD